MKNSRPEPFFILGAQRSGTTMLRLMLNAHPKLAVPFESEFIVKFFYRSAEYGDLSIPENRESLVRDIAAFRFVKKGGLIEDAGEIARRSSGDYSDIVRRIFEAYAARQGKPRWGDKSPGYLEHIERLALILPDARFVHLVRDGRDVCGSLQSLEWGKNNPISIALDWAIRTTVARKVGTVLGERYLEVKYEDLVLTPERELRRICDFLGEEYSPDMLGYDRDARAHMPGESQAWHGASMSPPDPSKVLAWKREWSYAEIMAFQDVAGRALDTFGYELIERRSDLPSRLRLRLHRLRMSAG